MDGPKFIVSLVLAISLMNLASCASGPEVNEDILTPVEEAPPTEKPAVSPPENPRLERLNERLSALGYEGIGLAFERDRTLEMLEAVFADTRLARRKIKLVYTGAQMAYDKKSEALTIGSLSNPKAAIEFIVRNVPLR